MSVTRGWRHAAVCALLLVPLAACGSGDAASGGDITIGYSTRGLNDTFQATQARLMVEQADEQGINLLEPVNANADAAKQSTDINTLLGQGVSALLVNPFDSEAIVPAIERANARDVPVVTVDSIANTGDVAIAVSTDELDAGRQGCLALGELVGGEGTVLNLQGALTTEVALKRSQGFTDCMESDFPDVTVVSKPMDWDAAECGRVTQTLMSTTQIDGIYTAAEIVCLGPVTTVLENLDRLVPAGEPGHVPFVGINGSPDSLQAIRDGVMDAVISTPLDLYARWAPWWANHVAEGNEVEEGPTDHDSVVERVGEQDQLTDVIPSTVVTRENVDDEGLWGNQG